MAGMTLGMSTSSAFASAASTVTSFKKRSADEPLLDPDRRVRPKRSCTSLRPSRRKYLQPNALESLSGIQDENAFQVQLERAISLVLAAQGFEGATPEALESFRGLVEQFSLHFLSIIRSSMILSGRNSPTPNDFVLALKGFGLSSSDLQAHLEVPSMPSITQPPVPVDLLIEPQPSKLDNVLGSDLILSSATGGNANTNVQRTAFSKFIPKHLPELPSLHTWQSTDIWRNERDGKREEGELDARKIREKATKEGVLAEQALRRLLVASKKSVPKNNIEDDIQLLESGTPDNATVKVLKKRHAWQSAKEAILALDKQAREAEEAEEAAAAAEYDDAIVMDMSDVLQPEQSQPVSLRRAKMLIEDDEEREDGADGLLAVTVNCDRRYWREGARGKH